jgi:DNA-binding response OmpR family regulator
VKGPRRDNRSVQLTLVEAAGRILVIEDDQRIGASLTRALEGNGYRTSWASTATDGEHAFRAARTDSEAFDLVLLDLGLPDADGLDVCRRLVALDPLVPVIMLTARDEELDLVIGLDAGAADYITKPFSLAPVLARLRAHLRRNVNLSVGHVGSRVDATDDPTDTTRLRIDSRARKVHVGDVEIALRAKEFDLLVRLATDPGSVVTRETLMADVWDENWFGSTKTLDFHIAALRTKLDVAGQPSRITTIRGIGFRFEG